MTAGSDDGSVGRRIREARERVGYNQRELAERLGHGSDGQVRRWERGEFVPLAGTLAELADVLGVPMDWIARGGTLPPEAAKPTPLARFLATKGKRVGPADRQWLQSLRPPASTDPNAAQRYYEVALDLRKHYPETTPESVARAADLIDHLLATGDSKAR